MDQHPVLLRAADTAIIAIDLQPTFLGVIHDADRVLAGAKLLLRSAAILGVPVIATTQNASRLGGTDDEIAAILADVGAPVIDKLTFSAARSDEFARALAGLDRKQIVLCGVETHICITQTALDLVAAGYQVQIAVDAVSSRTMEKHKLGMERLRDNGALPIAAEAVVYELLGQAGTPAFKQILPLVK
jgi:nicotinamidase-related amidase